MKEFTRTNVPLVERAISWVILLSLTGIGFAIWNQGRHFNPDKFNVSATALRSTTDAVTGKASTLRSETDADSLPKGNALDTRVPGLKPMGPTETYSPATLYEKINGRAPAYIEFKFQQLRCRSFGVTVAKDSFIDLFEYRMDSPINAFGIFALERDPKGKPIDFASDGYASGMSLFFRQGNCYVQVIASEQNSNTLALARALAAEHARTLSADDTGLDARRRLPATGQIPGSVAYVQENALGQAFLKGVFQATYEFEGEKLPFFVMVAKPDQAASAWKSFQEFCGRFGKVEVLPPVNGAQIFQAETFGTWKVIYQRDGELGGVFDAPASDKASDLVNDYLLGKLR